MLFRYLLPRLIEGVGWQQAAAQKEVEERVVGGVLCIVPNNNAESKAAGSS